MVRLANGFWAATGHAEALEVLRRPEMGSSPIAARYLEGLPDGAARDEMGHRINFLDPPDHPRVRGLVSKAFTPRRVVELRPWMARTIDALLARAERTAQAEGSEVDLLTEVAHGFPSLVISELLGVPVDDRPQLTAWSDAVAPLLGLTVSADDRAAAIAAAEPFHAYLGDLLDQRRRSPGDDLLTALVEAEEDGQRLTRPELLSLAATLWSAGHRTTRDLWANGMSVLLADPDRWSAVVTGRWSVPEVVSEFLRFETPTLYVVRVPLEPVSIAGEDLGAFEPVLVFLSAANRDPAVYPDPDAFVPRPGAPPALSFAFGAHYCLGASLARAEAEMLLDRVRSRWPALRLADDRPRRWHQRGPFRGLDELVVSPA